MKHTLCLIAGLFTLSFLSASAADEKTYPAKNPILKYEVPAKWTTEVDPADGDISIASDDERIAVSIVELPVAASVEMIESLVPDMVKEFENTKLVEAAKEQTADGLTGYVVTYAGTSDGSPVLINMVLFKAGKERSVLANFVLDNPATISKEQNEKFAAFMKSLQGLAK